MKILFEDSFYKLHELSDIGVPEAVYKKIDDKEIAQVRSIGYFYSFISDQPFFVLPKIFIKSQKVAVSETATLERKHEILPTYNKDGEKLDIDIYGIEDIERDLSVLIYKAIELYCSRDPSNAIVSRLGTQRIDSSIGNNEPTLLDLELSFEDFQKKNKNIITFKTITDRKGVKKINWKKTIQKELPIIRENIPIYLKLWNKHKVVNYDETLISLFYSVLFYLKCKFGSDYFIDFNYDLLKSSEIDSLIESGKGVKLLQSIRRQYFTDVMVKMWTLLFAFFNKMDRVRTSHSNYEGLVASSFQNIFEDMVDFLISDEDLNDYKKNEDGKRIDHLFKEKSIIDSSKIFYIGDSKYYKDTTDIVGESNKKQFTYAKNIIQDCIEIENKYRNPRNADLSRYDGIHYRDTGLTEGYNPTPNFFITGEICEIKGQKGRIDYENVCLQVDKKRISKEEQYQFDGRMFDRDTFLLKSFSINFMYVLRTYVERVDSKSVRKKIHTKIREEIIAEYNRKFDFFKVIIDEANQENFVKEHFKDYIGKMYKPYNSDFIMFAFPKRTMNIKELASKLNISEDQITKHTL